MNPLADLSHVSNTIFKDVDDICKKYLTPNSLALQRKQILESLLYRTILQDNESVIQQVSSMFYYNIALIYEYKKF